jgi:putative ABC transport system substrate-binding protein
MSTLLAAAAAGWIAFICPDFPQARALFAEYQARMGPELQARDLEARFVPVPDSSAPVDRLVAQALAGRPVLVVAPAHAVALSARRLAEGRVPVIFSTRSDPVRSGLVTSLARPGVEATGISYDVDIAHKQLELLRQLAPGARTVGVLADDIWLHEEMGAERLARLERDARLRLRVFSAKSPEDMVRLPSTDEAGAIDAWLVPITNYSGRARDAVVAALRQSGKPAVYGRSFFVDAGGLASYHEVIAQPMAILADLSRQVLGGRPARSIPVHRPREFELVLNMDAARELGIVFPASLLKNAHRVVGAPRGR